MFGADPTSSTSAREGSADRSVIERLLRELSLRERLVVCLRYAEGLSIGEIATVLDAGTAEVDRVLDHVTSRVRAAAGLSPA